MAPRGRPGVAAGYAVMIALTLVGTAAVLLPGLPGRLGVAAALGVGGWSFFLVRLRQRFRLQAQAASDPLTGLYNRLLLPDRLAEETARVDRHGGSLVLALLDLDDFKSINDSIGHLAGDEALRTFARAIRDSVRGSDLAFRFGGEEFVVLFPDSSPADAVVALCRLQRAVPATAFSAGLAVYPGDAGAGSDLLRAADARLRAAKGAGKGRIEAGTAASPAMLAPVPGPLAGEAPPAAG